MDLAKSLYFTNLDFPEIAGDFPEKCDIVEGEISKPTSDLNRETMD